MLRFLLEWTLICNHAFPWWSIQPLIALLSLNVGSSWVENEWRMRGTRWMNERRKEKKEDKIILLWSRNLVSLWGHKSFICMRLNHKLVMTSSQLPFKPYTPYFPLQSDFVEERKRPAKFILLIGWKKIHLIRGHIVYINYTLDIRIINHPKVCFSQFRCSTSDKNSIKNFHTASKADQSRTRHVAPILWAIKTYFLCQELHLRVSLRQNHNQSFTFIYIYIHIYIWYRLTFCWNYTEILRPTPCPASGEGKVDWHLFDNHHHR